jgi:hypothetical protein
MRRIHLELDQDGRPTLLGPDGVDPDLSDAAVAALGDLSISSVWSKYGLWLERFLCYEHDAGESYDAFLNEDRFGARRRIAGFLRAWGCSIGPSRNRRYNSVVVRRSGKALADIEIALIVVRAFYRALIDEGLFQAENPCDVDGWAQAAAIRLAEALRGRNERGYLRGESGHHFRVAERRWSPPAIDDPTGVGKRVIDAIDQHGGWPTGGRLLTMAMVDGGARFADTAPINVADWAVGSNFGCAALAPDKGSKGRRVKRIMFSDDLRVLIGSNFDQRAAADLSLPGLSELKTMFREGRLEELTRLPLFPNAHGRIFTYANYNNGWFRPTMQLFRVKIHSNLGERAPTPHWLRHASIESDLSDIYSRLENPDQIAAELVELKRYYGWKSEQVERYAAHFLDEMRLASRAGYLDRRGKEQETRPRYSTLDRSRQASTKLNTSIAALHAEMQP